MLPQISQTVAVVLYSKFSASFWLLSFAYYFLDGQSLLSPKVRRCAPNISSLDTPKSDSTLGQPEQFDNLTRQTFFSTTNSTTVIVITASMSIAVMDQFFGACPPPAVGAGVYYFSYDYYSLADFLTKFGSAKVIGVSWLKSWTWHVNLQGTQAPHFKV
jgi:hypothetical protein